MKHLYGSSFIKYFQDANTSMPYNLLCINPPSKVGEHEHNQSFYIGTAKLYDPGTNISPAKLKPVAKKEKPDPIAQRELVKPTFARPQPSTEASSSKPTRTRPQRPTDATTSKVDVTEPQKTRPVNTQCTFVIPGLKYNLTKLNGELILFDNIEFTDSSSLEDYGTIIALTRGEKYTFTK